MTGDDGDKLIVSHVREGRVDQEKVGGSRCHGFVDAPWIVDRAHGELGRRERVDDDGLNNRAVIDQKNCCP